MPCAHCSQPTSPGARFCEHCGRVLTRRCDECGAEATPDARFCAACGSALDAAASPAAAAPGDAADAPGERRHLTVLFCDLVNSTGLAASYDAEDWHAILAIYRAAAIDAVEQFGGHVAQHQGDGILVYLGYPRAREDDAERAVRAGLGIVAAIAEINPRLERAFGLTLALRVGVHSGMAVVSDLAEGERSETLALGETTDIASKLQDHAPPNGVILSEDTLRLVPGLFITEEHGVHELKGIAEPIAAYLAVRTSGVRSRLDIAEHEGLSPLVGRAQELGLLLDCWQQVLEGRGQTALISSDAGIGKSRLARELRGRLAGAPHTWLECRSSAYTQNSALFPVIELQQQAFGFTSSTTPDDKLDALRASVERAELPVDEYLPLFAEMHSVPLPEGVAPPSLSPAARKQKLIGGLREALLQLGRRQPVLLLFEDLHWADASTIELLGSILPQLPTERVFAILTYRPEFVPPWPLRGNTTPIHLNRLNRADLTRLVHGVLGEDELPERVVDEIVARTDGVPLFAEELTRAELAAGGSTEVRVPASLRDSLMAQLDGLGEAKEVAQLCATLGREFSDELVRAVSPFEPDVLDRGLERLVDRELVYRRGEPPRASYQFKHALIQEEAYGSLLRRTQRDHHRRIGETLEVAFPGVADTQPELLAHHFSEAGLAVEALPYWLQAGRRATQRSANVEAVEQLNRALELVPALPEGSERDRAELSIHGIRTNALAATIGRAAEDVRAAFARARELCRRLGETPELFPVVLGSWMYHVVRTDPDETIDAAAELMRLAELSGESGMRLEAHMATAYTNFWQGHYARVHEHAEHVHALFDEDEHGDHAFVFGQDPQAVTLAVQTWTRWLTGEHDAARETARRALAAAERSGHALTRASVHWNVGIVFLETGDLAETEVCAQRTVEIAGEQHFAAQVAAGNILLGAVAVERGDHEAGLDRLRGGVDGFRGTGSNATLPYHLSVLARALQRAGRHEEALSVVDDALAFVGRSLDRYYRPELLRRRGELLLARGDGGDAKDALADAIAIAEEQGATTLLLRALTSAARSDIEPDLRAASRERLSDVLRTFDGQKDAPDVAAARSVRAIARD